MKIVKGLVAAALLAAPMLASAVPAEARTAFQYQAQGHGAYVSSKARGYGWHRGWRRHSWHRNYWHRRHWRHY